MDSKAYSMEIVNNIKAVQAKTRKVWRKWLEKNHKNEKSVWLIIYHKKSKTKSIYYPEAVEEALCFGWIDSKPNKRDEESFYLYFAQRKRGSVWSKINRERVKKLTDQGLMTEAGHAMVDYAKKSGNWETLVMIEQEIMSPDLMKEFNKNKLAFKNFNAFPPSSRKIILGWIASAKTPETRNKRIKESVTLAEQNIRANHYIRKK